MGHLMRCSSIASLLQLPATLAVREPGKEVKKLLKGAFEGMVVMKSSANVEKFTSFLQPNDLVILDGYNFNPTYQQKILDKGAKIISIDDTALFPYLGNAVINHGGGLSPGEFHLAPNTQLYLGPKFAMLRMAFLKAPAQPRKINSIESIFIALGGADPENKTLRILNSIAGLQSQLQVHVVMGAANLNRFSIEKFARENPQIRIQLHYSLSAESMVELLQNCQIAITPASTMSYEACCAGLGLIVLQTADNQARIFNFLQEKQMALGVPTGENEMNLLPELLTDLIRNPQKVNQMIQSQREHFDGKSAERIKEIILNIFES
ncbi:MAG: UDP-2,4-diacetamido-2,4,6-trideoxy-beta-L-altropyranose hydrolase [Bacteroidia bacterium]|nr:UDP-2,4-diacetamido-2,4,6-trideoxy-beta-L-altropyranose hydrolase [Bacteroidia bacterium]